MNEEYFDIEAPTDVLQAIITKAKLEGIECSEPIPSDTSNPLHSPLSGAEIKEILEVAILVFKSGAAATLFISQLYDLLQKFGDKGVVRVKDRKNKSTKIITNESKKNHKR